MPRRAELEGLNKTRQASLVLGFSPHFLDRYVLLPAARAAIGLCLAAAVAQACGPSVQTIYEGNVRFEHCYRLDLDTAKAPSHRHACWRNWLQVYTYAQPRDRIEYARRRLRSLEAGDPDRPSLNLGNQYRPEQRQWYLSAPTPVNAHAPPPATAERWDSGASSPIDAGTDAGQSTRAPEPPPEQQCSIECKRVWEECLNPCSGDLARPAPKACVRCEPDYLACMRRCFK